MAKRRRRGGPNQSAFIRELFGKNPDLKLGDANKAWTEAGNSGEIGTSLFYVIKRKLGLTRSTKSGKRRGRPPGSGAKGVVSAGRRASGYEAIEDALDEVIQKLREFGDLELVDELRTARRKIGAKLV
jgi:hypothetical protein